MCWGFHNKLFIDALYLMGIVIFHVPVTALASRLALHQPSCSFIACRLQRTAFASSHHFTTKHYHIPSPCFSVSDTAVAKETPSLLKSTSDDDMNNDNTRSVSCPRNLSPLDAQHVVDTLLLPQNKYGDRIARGGDAQNLNREEVVKPDDPSMTLAYGEFPLSSFDSLLDLGLEYAKNGQTIEEDSSSPFTLVDLGSGCGRLALYAGLSRPSHWNVHGIEISKLLHDVGVEALKIGIQDGIYVSSTPQPASEENESSPSLSTNLHLHVGPADRFSNSVLPQANMIFAYSTVWSTSGFSVELGAMVLEEEWNTLLAQSCQDGCIAITTDRALDPQYGWKLVDRLDVENREVFGSTGYVHVLEKK